MIRYLFSGIVFAVLLLLCVSAVVAQDVTAEPTVIVTVEPPPVDEPDTPPVEQPDDGSTSLLATLVFLSGIVTAIVETVKPGVKQLPLNAAWHDLILRAFGFGLGVAFVFSGGSALNLFTLSPTYRNDYPAAGLFLTGLLVGGGGQLIYLLASGIGGRLFEPRSINRYVNRAPIRND